MRFTVSVPADLMMNFSIGAACEKLSKPFAATRLFECGDILRNWVVPRVQLVPCVMIFITLGTGLFFCKKPERGYLNERFQRH